MVSGRLVPPHSLSAPATPGGDPGGDPAPARPHRRASSAPRQRSQGSALGGPDGLLDRRARSGFGDPGATQGRPRAPRPHTGELPPSHGSAARWEAPATALVRRVRSGRRLLVAAWYPALLAFLFEQVTVPALASVYNEKALKSQFDTSIYLQNLFLYGYGAIFNFLGLVITAIIQDTILKKYSSTIATIFTGVASAVLFGHTLTINFVLGISIVIISMHQYLSNQIKDEVPSSKAEMADAHDHRFSVTAMHIDLYLYDLVKKKFTLVNRTCTTQQVEGKWTADDHTSQYMG